MAIAAGSSEKGGESPLASAPGLCDYREEPSRMNEGEGPYWGRFGGDAEHRAKPAAMLVRQYEEPGYEPTRSWHNVCRRRRPNRILLYQKTISPDEIALRERKLAPIGPLPLAQRVDPW